MHVSSCACEDGGGERQRQRTEEKCETLPINGTELAFPFKSTTILMNIYIEALTHLPLRAVKTLATTAKNVV